MKVLVTVGTTSFDKLFDYIEHLNLKGVEFTLQTGPTDLELKRHHSFKFTDEIEQYYRSADIIISHAGAGSTYKLLALDKPVILVPNLERVDKHQADLASFMEAHNHLAVAWQLDQIPKLLSKISSGELAFTPYTPERFFMKSKLMELVLS
ncbi:PssE/Cps14G family polysaccharide biosynthesis glycosyltransferase [Thalassotalea montiporae]